MKSEYIRLSFDGVLDISRYPEFAEAFKKAPRNEAVLVDLTRVAGVDSVFLSELLIFKRKHNGPVSIVITARGQVARLFDIAHFGSKMNVFTTDDEAVASLGLPTAEQMPEKTLQ